MYRRTFRQYFTLLLLGLFSMHGPDVCPVDTHRGIRSVADAVQILDKLDKLWISLLCEKIGIGFVKCMALFHTSCSLRLWRMRVNCFFTAPWFLPTTSAISAELKPAEKRSASNSRFAGSS